MPKLTINENNRGFTDEFTVTFTDFLSAQAGTIADDTAKTFTYAAPAGTVVTKAGFKLVTAFNDSGGGDDLGVTVGVSGGDVDGFVATTAIHTDDSPVTYAYNSGALLDNEDQHIFQSAGDILITFTPNVDADTSYSLNELTAGEIVFKFELTDLN
jgi:hypothetical protein